MVKSKEELRIEVETRRDELIDEYGDDEYDEIEVNEILRDEFSDDEYDEILIELGINTTEEDLGLETNELAETIGDNNESKENLMKVMLSNNKHVLEIYLTLLGYENSMGKLKFTGKTLIPKKDIKFMIGIISSLYQPQSLSSKLKKNIKYFDDHYNSILNNFRERLENYPDKICSATDLRIAVDMFLNEVITIRTAIMEGRLGDLTRDVANNSYTEKDDLAAKDSEIDKLKKELNF